MSSGGFLRLRLERSLRSAYAVGLVTQDTFAHRIDRLYSAYVVDPQQLVGDLTFRRHPTARPGRAWLQSRLRRRGEEASGEAGLLILALDWTGATPNMVLGRGSGCDLLIDSRSVSRRHAQLFFREGRWILVDLESTNGTYINGERVRRAELLPGDIVALGTEQLRVD